jgi:hypothetical protein
MDNDLKKIKKLATFMKKEGVIELECGQIKIKLHPAKILSHIENSVPAEHTQTDIQSTPEYTEEEMLFWSSPGIFPEEANQ